MIWIARCLLLPALMVLAFVAFAMVSDYFSALVFPRVLPRPYVEMMSAATVGSLAAALLTAWPLARLYGKAALPAAIVIASPMIALRTGDLLRYSGGEHPRIVVMAWFELIVYPLLIAAGVWIVRRNAGRARKAVEKLQ